MQTSISQISLFIIISCAVIFLLACLIVTILYLYQKRQLLYHRNLHTLKLDFERNLLKAQVEIQEQTCQNISREIHDNINLSLTLAKLNLNTLDWIDLEQTHQSVKTSVHIIGSAIADLNNLSKSMNSDLIKDLGLMKAIKNEVDKLKEMAHLEVNYDVSGDPIFMECEKELIIFRIIQEAFNNIIKHADASKVWLQLNYSNGYLDVLIKDNGKGFIKEEVSLENVHNKAGLKNMQTRSKIFGGQLIIESRPQRGTQILVTVPYH
jgi:signal transduction histidine kinase